MKQQLSDPPLNPPGSRIIPGQSLSWVITVVIVIVVTLVSVSSLLINLVIVTRENEQHFEKNRRESLTFLQDSLKIPLWNFDLEAVEKITLTALRSDIIEGVVITDFKGDILLSHPKPLISNQSPEQVTIFFEDNRLGTVDIYLTHGPYIDQRNQFITIALVTMLAVIGSIVIVVTFSVRRFIRKPLENLSQQINAIADGNYQLHKTRHPYIELNTIMEHVDLMAYKIRDREGSLEESNRALTIEIEERTKAEKLLRESEYRYRSLSENLPIGVFRSNTKGDIISYNPAILKMLKAEEDQNFSQRKTYEFYVDPEAREQFLNILKKDGQVKGFECQYERNDQQNIWVSISATAIKNMTNEIEYIDGAIEDITERKSTLKELNQARNYISSIIDSLPSILVGVDIDANITQCNATAREFADAVCDSPLGCPLLKVFPFLKSDIPQIMLSIQKREPWFKQKRPRMSGIDLIHEDITVYPLLSEEAEGAVIRIDNVTDQVHLEEMMIQNEKMRSVGGLAAGMAHEINNPLGIILGLNQTIMRRLSPEFKKNEPDAEKAGVDLHKINEYMKIRGIHDYMSGIREAGMRAAKIVKNMLEFSRKSESTRIESSIQQIMDKAIELASTDYDLKKMYDFKLITIDRQYHSEPILVSVIETEIEQVLLNILKNAAHAMSEKKYVENSPKITLRILKEEQWTRIEVIDNGPGMEEHIRKRIFEPFFTTKPVDVGTGLGLSVSYFIITNTHNGEFLVESESDKGTKLIIRLPIET